MIDGVCLTIRSRLLWMHQGPSRWCNTSRQSCGWRHGGQEVIPELPPLHCRDCMRAGYSQL